MPESTGDYSLSRGLINNYYKKDNSVQRKSVAGMTMPKKRYSLSHSIMGIHGYA